MRIQNEINSLALEARARIIWGKPPNEIRKWLSEQSVSSSDIERIVCDAIHERSLEFRKRGVVEIVLGFLIIICICAIIAGSKLVAYLYPAHYAEKLFAILVVIGLYGIYKVRKGLFWIIEGSKSGDPLPEA